MQNERLKEVDFPMRPAWVEIDLSRLRENLRIIRADLSPRVRIMAVVKDDAYGHGAVEVARIAVEEGVWGFGLSTLEEALTLREAGITAPLVLLGERQEEELPWCLKYNLTVCVNRVETVRVLGRLARESRKRIPIHVKLNTGMNRFGVRWDEAMPLFQAILEEESLVLEGVMTHFAQSDEADKTFANLQVARFDEVISRLKAKGIQYGMEHLCNSGGFLDLPHAHRDMVRIGILMYGVYPSAVCRRIPGIRPVMSVKARVAGFQNLKPGDSVGYGMRYKATTPRRIAIIPVGYGDGYPRVINTGEVLIRGRRVPIVGGVTMDALMVDVTELPEVSMWDEVVLMGEQGNEEISVHEIAKLKGSVSYDVLTSWRLRLKRVCRR